MFDRLIDFMKKGEMAKVPPLPCSVAALGLLALAALASYGALGLFA